MRFQKFKYYCKVNLRCMHEEKKMKRTNSEEGTLWNKVYINLNFQKITALIICWTILEVLLFNVLLNNYKFIFFID